MEGGKDRKQGMHSIPNSSTNTGRVDKTEGRKKENEKSRRLSEAEKGREDDSVRGREEKG